MKVFSIASSILLLSVLVLGSCSKDSDTEKAGWNEQPFLIHVCDSEGNDLLDPDNPKNILSGTYIEYLYIKFPVKYDVEEKFKIYDPYIHTEYPMYPKCGLQLLSPRSTYFLDREDVEINGLLFMYGIGEGREECEGSFTIYWGDGSKDVVSFRYWDYKWGKEAEDIKNLTENSMQTFNPSRLRQWELLVNGKNTKGKLYFVK